MNDEHRSKRMKRIVKLFIMLVPALGLTCCDAVVGMTYSVKNKSSRNVQLFVPSFPVGKTLNSYSDRRDTLLVLKPREMVIVGLRTKIDFPWGAKNIYRAEPGYCGLYLVEPEGKRDLDCSKKEWQYKRGNSRLTIR